MDETDDAEFSEVTILPDGRLYVFGLTRPLLEVLASVPSREGCWQALLEQVREPPAPADGQETARE
jgi:hypothetical protein